MFELPSVELLMSQQLVKKVAPLLVDTTMTVREVAAGTLRCRVASLKSYLLN